MNDAELDQLIAAAATVSDAEVMAWDLAAPEAHLREEIMSTTASPVPGSTPDAPGTEPAPAVVPAGPAPSPDADVAGVAAPAGVHAAVHAEHAAEPAADGAGPTVIDLTRVGRGAGPGSPRSRRRRVLALVAAAAVTVAAVGAITLAGDADDEQVSDVASGGAGSTPTGATDNPAAPGADPGATPATAEDLALVAQLPTLAPSGSEWAITYFNASSVEEGDMSISAVGPSAGDDPARLDLWWAPADHHDEWVADAESAFGPGQAATVAGQPATVFEASATADPGVEGGPGGDVGATGLPDDGSDPSFSAFLVVGDHAVTVTGRFPSRQELDAALATLELVPPETWVTLVPAVLPSQRPAVVDGMLADIPLPPGFDPEAVRAPTPAVPGPYHVGADVTGAVACGWIDSWVAARAAGDSAAAQAAVDAMATAHDWDVLADMEAQGDWPGVLLEYADALPTDGPVSGGRPLTVTESYANALGC